MQGILLQPPGVWASLVSGTPATSRLKKTKWFIGRLANLLPPIRRALESLLLLKWDPAIKAHEREVSS